MFFIGASFILYNCARLATLFKEFDKRVASDVYPALPSFENIDLSLLNQPVSCYKVLVNVCIFQIILGRVGTFVSICITVSLYSKQLHKGNNGREIVYTQSMQHLIWNVFSF